MFELSRGTLCSLYCIDCYRKIKHHFIGLVDSQFIKEYDVEEYDVEDYYENDEQRYLFHNIYPIKVAGPKKPFKVLEERRYWHYWESSINYPFVVLSDLPITCYKNL